MIFQERKTDTGYTYDVEDVFGTIHIESSAQLEPAVLDDMVVLLLKQNLTAQTIEGTVRHKDVTVGYTFKRAALWEEDDEQQPCDDTPTSTPAQATVSIAIPRSLLTVWYWCKRFVEAFREAWKKTT